MQPYFFTFSPVICQSGWTIGGAGVPLTADRFACCSYRNLPRGHLLVTFRKAFVDVGNPIWLLSACHGGWCAKCPSFGMFRVKFDCVIAMVNSLVNFPHHTRFTTLLFFQFDFSGREESPYTKILTTNKLPLEPFHGCFPRRNKQENSSRKREIICYKMWYMTSKEVEYTVKWRCARPGPCTGPALLYARL